MMIQPRSWLAPLVILVILGAATSAHGGAREFVATPDNITKQLLALRVESTPSPLGTVVFDVFVSAGRDSIFPDHNARLEIGEWTVGHGSSEMQALTEAKIWCNLQEKVEQGTLHYRFGLAVEWVEDARFEFSNSRRGITLDIYRLPLKRFVVSR